MTTSQTTLLDDPSTQSETTQSGRNLFAWISGGTGIAGGAMMLVFLAQAVRQPLGRLVFWEFLALAVVFGSLSALSWFFRTGSLQHASRRALRLAISVQLSMIILAMLVKDTGIPAALIALVFTLIIGFLSLSFQRSSLIVMFGIVSAIVAYFFNSFSPAPQASLPMMQINLIALVGLLLMVYMTMLAMGFVVATLGVKLITAALAISLAPLLIYSAVQSTVTHTALLNESSESLRLASHQTATTINAFVDENLRNLRINSIYPVYGAYLKMPEESRNSSPQENAVGAAMTSLAEAAETYLNSIALLDNNGMNVYDTRNGGIGQSEKNQEYFSVPINTPANLQSGYVSPITFSQNNTAFLVFSNAILDENKKMIGVLRIRYNGAVLQHLTKTSSAMLGPTSYSLLVDENGIILGDGSGKDLLYHPITALSVLQKNDLMISRRLPQAYADQSAMIPDLQKAIDGSEVEPFFTFQASEEQNGIESAGTVVRLKSSPWNVVYIQQMTSFSDLIQQQSRTTTLLATLLALIVSLVAALLARLFSVRILNLAQTAEQITAGNLEVNAEVDGGDEIGMLGRAFNVMIRQLHTLIDELEARVASRTSELSLQNEALQTRSQQLKTVSDVARSIASTNDLEELLNQVAMLVSHRFGFYHVGIFLVDEKKEYAYLRAANSEGGRQMLERQHKLKIGEVGIVGYTCGQGEARITTDVGQDATYFNNPDLPYTRSEMALPLKAGNDIIGALDVQSVEPNAFTKDDIELFSILSDQVAIAIVNNRLYAETNQALEEIQGLHRWYLRNEWNKIIEERVHSSYRYTTQGIIAGTASLDPEIEQMLETGGVVIQGVEAGDETAQTALAVPIVLRGETIGSIQLQDQGNQEREWSQTEISSVRAVAEQIALALENARLFEETAHRAERERKVLEISSKIRATNDYQTMLRVAVEELQKALNASRAQVILQTVEPSISSDRLGSNGTR